MWLPHAVFAAALFLQAGSPQSEGLKALDEQRYDAAAGIFAKAAEADPTDYSAHFHLAFALSMLSRDAEAIASYRKVLALQPDLYQAQLNLGVLLLRNRKELEEAQKLLAAAAKAKPAEYRPAYYAAEAALAGGNHVEAESRFRKAVEIDPNAPGAHAGLGRALLQQGKLDEAAPPFAKAAELDPQYRDGLFELAARYESAKRNDQAIAIYRKFPDDPAVKERLGAMFLEQGKSSEAIRELESAVARSATPANLYALSVAYLQAKQASKAIPLLEKAAAASPENTQLRMTLGRAFRDARSFDRAAREFFAVAQAKPDFTEAWSELAGMLILLQRDQDALIALEKLRALGAEQPSHHFFRALVLDRNKQYEPALDSYEKFLASSGGKFPDEEFKARQRVKVIKKEIRK